MSKYIKRLAFHKNGRPRGWVRRLVFDRRMQVRPIFRRVVYKKNGKIRPNFLGYMMGGSGHLIDGSGPRQLSLDEWLRIRWQFCSPLQVFTETMEQPRITIVTDSVGPSSLFGGVGTSLILGALWAKRSQATLRIVTRTEPPDSTALRRVLEANGLEFAGQVDFQYCPLDGGSSLAVGEKDMFLSTSWWSTRSLLDTVGPTKTVYLLQEDERLFYANSDDHLACETTLAEPVCKVVINTGHLHEHLTNGPNAIAGLAGRAIAFEPAFPLNPTRRVTAHERRRLFFYARPNNHRNLFATGIMALGEAIEAGKIDPEVWEIHMIGNDLPNLIFPMGMTVVMRPTMAWSKYHETIAQMDAGFVLQYTPHPSYPPLDLAAIGLPILTNSYGVKRDLSSYSGNIISVPLEKNSLIQGLGHVTALAADGATLAANLRNDRINRDWSIALEPVIAELTSVWKASGQCS